MAVFLGLGLPGVAVAVDVPTLYSAEVPFDSRASDARADAYELALKEVLIRVSGAEFANNALAVSELFPDPASYVIQFRPGAEETLWVSFDGTAVEQVLRNAGQTVWGADRPLTLIWLAVDWGRGSREIIGADDPDRNQSQGRSINRNKRLRERVLAIAEKRGLPVVFPLLDTTDLQSVSFSDIWGGFDERILAASQRYDAKSILIGRIRPSPGRENWSYYFGNRDRSWNGSPESVVSQVADLLAAEFAIGGNMPVETVSLSVSGIQTVEAYGSLQQMLAGVNAIESHRIVEVIGDRVSYRVDVRGGAERLGRALRFNGLIEQDRADRFDEVGPGESASLEFFYGL
ncbi:MAG: DUF2066 domain-containing protein [Woeseiaceae bacterium]